MYIKCSKTSAKHRERLGLDYYSESEKMYGNSPFRKLSLARIIDKSSPSELLMRLDKNYANTIAGLQLAYDPFSELIALYNDNSYMIAHTTLGFINDVNNDYLIPYITDIIIKNGDQLVNDEKSNINFKLGIYRKILTYYEEIVNEFFPESEKYMMITHANDGDLWHALHDREFTIQNSDDLAQGFFKFTKPVRERDLSDAGHTTRK